jgi:hypothetical protein
MDLFVVPTMRFSAAVPSPFCASGGVAARCGMTLTHLAYVAAYKHARRWECTGDDLTLLDGRPFDASELIRAAPLYLGREAGDW